MSLYFQILLAARNPSKLAKLEMWHVSYNQGWEETTSVARI